MNRDNEYEYLSLLKDVRRFGTERTDRTGVGTKSIFGVHKTYAVDESFPILTTKKIAWKSIVTELLWFLNGDTNTKYLKEHGCTIWDEWADANGDLGPVYGAQWRNFNGVDQIEWLLNEIRTNPDSRRLIVSAWNPHDLPRMALAPCHTMFQVYCDNGHMDLQLYQRSADIFLGVPFNIASYSLLLCLLCEAAGYKPRYFFHAIGDAHIYTNHFEQVDLQLQRGCGPFPSQPACPVVTLSEDQTVSLKGLTHSCINLVGYNSLPAIKAPVAV